ncbi:MAG: histidine phosphatase family protein [Chromatiaceae bacterium]|nr:MAG: histidine phosphatase family protein [Chromatiaceae bacterium]
MAALRHRDSHHRGGGRRALHAVSHDPAHAQHPGASDRTQPAGLPRRRPFRRWRLARWLSLLLATATLAAAPADADPSGEAALWGQLAAGRAVALLRHALAPGTGDPPGMVLDECRTQRNLSAAGRDQARAIGARLRAHGIDRAEVRSSQWCRCLDTARLLGVGEVQPFPALNSFFADRRAATASTEATRALVLTHLAPTVAAASGEQDRSPRPLILVTHQVNITALTGVFPASGEMLLVGLGADGLEVRGRLPPP